MNEKKRKSLEETRLRRGEGELGINNSHVHFDDQRLIDILGKLPAEDSQWLSEYITALTEPRRHID
jgi:hypothetical protein